MAKKKTLNKQLAQNYNLMRSSIFGKDGDYQYFKGRAFSNQRANRGSLAMRNSIREEVWSVLGTTPDDKTGYAKAVGDLEAILNKKISDYYVQEKQLYERLIKVVDRAALTAHTSKEEISQKLTYEFYSPSTSISDCIAQWDSLMSFPLNVLFAGKTSDLDFSSNQRAALYCFLQSDELYQAVKNIKEISSVFSRKSWLKGQDISRLSEYNDDIKKVEDEMIQSLVGGNNTVFLNAMQDALIEAAGTQFSKVIMNSFGKYVQKHPIPEVNTYAQMHDVLKAWGEDLLLAFNSHKFSKAQSLSEIKIDRVEVKNNGVVYFTIKDASGQENIRSQVKGQAQGKNEAERAKDALYRAIDTFISNKKKEGSFELTLLGYGGKVHFSSNTATAALKMFRNATTVFRKAFDDMLNTYVKEGAIKSIDNNAVLTGILGEFANYINPTIAGLKSTMMGAKQQEYDGKNSGMYFSDLVINNIKINYNGKVFMAGMNIKNYMDGNDHFTLAKGQKEGLDLTDVKLRRYLTKEDIKILAFLQANQKLIMSCANMFGGINMDISSAAEAIMNKNIVNIFRIESAEQQVINYLVSANGHFIPASCIFKVALKKLKNNESYRFYEVLDAKPWDFEKQYGEFVDTSKLKIDDLMRQRKSVKYKLNEFTVSVNELK